MINEDRFKYIKDRGKIKRWMKDYKQQLENSQITLTDYNFKMHSLKIMVGEILFDSCLGQSEKYIKL